MTSLHLGCGPASKDGDVGVDLLPGPAVDVVHDLNVFPWPLPDSTYDYVLCKDVLEHLTNIVRVMEEIWRVSVNGARIDIQVPAAGSMDFFTDPTHIRAFGATSFDYFDPDRPSFSYGYSTARFKVEFARYVSHEGETFRVPDALAEKFANRFTEFYERRLIYIYPMRTLRIRIHAIKNE
jgi:SAM-dependent methyltransferase